MLPSFKRFGFGTKPGFPVTSTTNDPLNPFWVKYKVGKPRDNETWSGALTSLAATLPKQVDICFSGKDSVILAKAIKDSGRNVNLWWLDIMNDPNRPKVEAWAKSLGQELNVLPANLETCLAWAEHWGPKIKVCKPTYVLVPMLFPHLKNFIIVGEGDPEKSAASYPGHTLTPGKLVVNYAELSYDYSIELAGKVGYGSALSATPALVRTAQKLVKKTDAGDLTISDSILSALPGFDMVDKTDNWEGRYDLNKRVGDVVRSIDPSITSLVTADVEFL
jgi:hypothetical protein